MSRTPMYTDMGWSPEDNALWKYDLLTEPLLSSELHRLAGANSYHGTDCVTFQPCPNPEFYSQDRYVVVDWAMPNGTWKFCAVFDGHGGHDTVDHTRDTLPALVRDGLTRLISEEQPSVEVVSQMLVDAISSVDDKITQDILSLFPDVNTFINLSNDAVRSIINDQEYGGKNSSIISRCMRGTTVLISLVDPQHSNLWVASLGDSQAALGIHQPDGSWETALLSSYHNGADTSEKERIFREHPGEGECVVKDRVLGAIAVTRAVGDHLFKLPPQYTERILMNAKQGFLFTSKIEEFLWRNQTPPYISNRADVRHSRLDGKESLLVLCSDGLLDLYEHLEMEPAKLADYWIQLMAGARSSENLALHLLRDSLGGENIESVSRMMTVEMSFRWMDDTTILVQKF